MQNIQELFDFVLQQDRSIVFGNLGRYPQLLLETVKAIPLLRVVLVVNHYRLSSSIDRIHILRSDEPIDKCDLLIYVEPASLQLVEKHPMASRVVVFTSHYTFKTPLGEWWTDVCYFHGIDSVGTKQLLDSQDFPIQTRNVSLVQADHANVLTISGKGTSAPIQNNTYVIVDLTNFNKDTLSMYLAFWDSFDYLLEHKNFIHRWVVCFPENGRQAFTRFTQKVLDALFCRKFEHGNVKETAAILSLIPFYKSGTIDKTFDVKLSSFGGIRFVAPKTIQDACKAAVMYNALPIVRNVLWVRE